MDDYQQFMKDFHHYSGIDLESYKRPQMERRLASLRDKHAFTSFSDFLSGIRGSRTLFDELLDKMTINVSEFMRNTERWTALIPHLRGLTEQRSLAAWSAACSTGEEPYTLAMLMEEDVRRPYHILATDIDRRVLQQAEHGEYREHQVKSLPETYIQRYFLTHGSTWSVDARLKKHVEFQHHNLLADAYPSELDLIVCRNVLIYFTDQAKQDIISGFAKALKPGGLLFVGSTEQFLNTSRYGLESVGPFLYQKAKDV